MYFNEVFFHRFRIYKLIQNNHDKIDLTCLYFITKEEKFKRIYY